MSQSYTLWSSWMKHGRKVIGFWRERGLSEGFKNFRQLKEIQAGELKGVDRSGNQYWEDKTAVTGRNRWVVYPSRAAVQASSVPAEWHPWLHYMVDETPLERPPVNRQFLVEHEPTVLSNQGAAANYLPPGHILSARNTTYGQTGPNAEERIDGAYQSWKSKQADGINPANTPKIERR